MPIPEYQTKPDELQNPFKALKNYENTESDIDLFRGRKEETNQLVRSVRNHVLTLIYGPSGVGKTSIINAGVIPLLGKSYCPITISLKLEWSIDNLLKEIYKKINPILYQVYYYNHQYYKLHYENILLIQHLSFRARTLLKDWNPGTMWEFFHRIYIVPACAQYQNIEKEINRKDLVTPVLIIDQFEELFTLGRYRGFSKALQVNLVDLIENFVPRELANSLYDEQGIPFNNNIQRYRVILSLREDYLPNFLSLFSNLSFDKKAEFRISYFTKNQAKEVTDITKYFSGEIGNHIINFFDPVGIGDNDFSHSTRVEPALLSLLCFQYFELLRTQGMHKDLRELLIKNKDSILLNFYNAGFEELSENDKINTKIFIEDQLITPDGYRTFISFPETHHMFPKLRLLEDKWILRTIHYSGKPYLEIIHDILIPVIKKSKEERIYQEKLKSVKKEQRYKYIKYVAAIAMAGLAISVYLAVQNYKARQSLQIYGIGQQSAQDDPKSAFLLMNTAYQKYPFPQIKNHMRQILWENPLYEDVYKGDAQIYWADMINDGSFLIAEGDEIKYVDTTGLLLRKGFKHKGKVVCFSVSKNQRFLLSSDETGDIILWDFLTTKPLKAFSAGYASPYLPVLFISDSLFLISRKIGVNNFVIELRDLNLSIRHTYVGHTRDITNLQKAKNSHHFISTSIDKYAIKWNILRPKEKILFKHDRKVSSSALSPDGKSILTSTFDHQVILWDGNGKMKQTFNGPNYVVVSVQFLPDGLHLIGNFFNGSSVIWRLDGSEVCRLKGHTFEIVKSYFSADNRIVYTFSGDSTIKKWDLGCYLNQVFTADARIPCARLSPDGSKVLACFRDSIAVWDRYSSGKKIAKAGQDSVWWVSWSYDGSKILSCGEDGTIKIWNSNLLPDSSLWPHVLKKHRKAVWFAEFVDKDSNILSASMDSTAIYSKLDGSIVLLKGHNHYVYNAWLLPNGYFLTCSRDKTAILWNSQGKVLKTFSFPDRVKSCAFSSNGNYYAFGIWGENAIYLYDVKKSRFAKFHGHKSLILSVRFSSQGDKLISCDTDNKSIVWDLNGTMLQKFEYHSAQVTSCEFSLDGKYIITSSNDFTVSVWQLLRNMESYRF